ncbi:MAG: hypothetical protein QT11_C0001G0429 [archaeon GW2011_AR20]|nr:MAG: hypothetical protein QT11_C0001G0429 [archaeon GW2011_AR20]AQS28101.1 hypothetical protein [uncultured archaeon]MBS3160432.1 DUF1931 domain-containing protein [Candidatus Woesearchaeota archaeon]AQS28592.1 hypothetical protein [uncultured archaeon]AQS28702.1 hypothetical protein [uncultured archaeon]
MAKETLVVKSRLKEVVLKYGKNKVRNMSEDFAKRLSEEVESLITKAVKRAEENKRATVQSRDL